MRPIVYIAIAAALQTSFAGGSASAQSINVPDALKRVIGAVKQVQQAAPPPNQSPTAPRPVPAGMTPSTPQLESQPVLWPDKAAFLQAARNGELTGIPKLTMFGDDDFAPVLRSIALLLSAEYRVPPISRDAGCQLEFRESTKRIMRAATEVHTETLGDRGPDFYIDRKAGPSLANNVAALQRAGGYCDLEVLGQRRAHPYRAALLSLMTEYSGATKEFIDVERARRKVAYEAELARVAAEWQAAAEAAARREAEVLARAAAERQAAADAAAKREAEARAAEQARIDAERARIEADQRRRQQIEKNRVAG